MSEICIHRLSRSYPKGREGPELLFHILALGSWLPQAMPHKPSDLANIWEHLGTLFFKKDHSILPSVIFTSHASATVDDGQTIISSGAVCGWCLVEPAGGNPGPCPHFPSICQLFRWWCVAAGEIRAYHCARPPVEGVVTGIRSPPATLGTII